MNLFLLVSNNLRIRITVFSLAQKKPLKLQRDEVLSTPSTMFLQWPTMDKLNSSAKEGLFCEIFSRVQSTTSLLNATESYAQDF